MLIAFSAAVGMLLWGAIWFGAELDADFREHLALLEQWRETD